MTENFRYMCSKCGQEHENWPALTYDFPSNYLDLTDDEKLNIAELDSDFCIIKYPDQTDRFIRCTLTINVIDYCETLEYGVWVSLSEKSFMDYSENFQNENHQSKYFGWFCNHLPDYLDFTIGIPTTIITRSGNLRPEVIPHMDFNHQLVRDYYNGISIKEATKRIENMLSIISQRE